MSTKAIPVTKSFLPPMQEYFDMIAPCWDNFCLTNNGPIVQKFETQLRDFLAAKHVFSTNNGTTALQLAIQALNLKNEIITTPFSYVATTSSILWEHCKPVFVDISPDDFCIDVKKIEEKITPNTEAILAVHVYGNPCDVVAIQEIADRHNLKVIYDAAHAFGVRMNGKSITEFGDISTLSFHATKLLHSVEGGAIVTADNEAAKKITLQRAFGHTQDDHHILGINGKMNEFQAAMGLCNLPYIDSIRLKRKTVCDLYDDELKSISQIQTLKFRAGAEKNYSYYPIVLENEKQCLMLQSKLKDYGVHARRYFYPSLNTLPYVEYEACPVSEDISVRILCLPLFSELGKKDASYIVEKIREGLKSL